jgi:hypothetical protein
MVLSLQCRGESNNVRKFNRRSVLILLASLLATAGLAAQQSPTAAMTAYYNAAKEKDFQALKTLLSDAYLKELAKAPVPLERLLQPQTENLPPALQVRNERTAGDRATLEVRNAAGTWETISFVREKGGWKLALDDRK